MTEAVVSADGREGRFGKEYPYYVLLALGTLAIIVGFIYTPSFTEIGNGLKNIIFAHHRIDSELVTVAGNMGSGFVNAGLLMYAMWATFKLFKTDIKGLEWAAIGQIFGYAFYAESLFNVWPLIIGVMVQAKLSKKDMGEQVFVAWFATALAPFVSTLAFHVEFINPRSPFAIAFGISVGLFAGYLVGKFSTYVKTLHRGRLLFNVGFTTGIVGWFTYNIIKAWGFEQTPVADQTYLQGKNTEIYLVFMVFNIFFFLAGMFYNGGKDGGVKDYFKTLFWARTDGGNYVEMYGTGHALMNVGIMGTAAMAYTLLTPGGQLNGPIIGGAYTVAGFGAFGMTLKSVAPIWLGIYGGSILFGGIGGVFLGEGFLAAGLAKAGSRSMCVAAMHCCGSSPVAERDGWYVATMIGALHTINVVNTGVLNGWMQSYNNGFSQGLILTLFYPAWHFFSKEKNERGVTIGGQ